MINEHKKGTRAKIYLKHTKPATNPVAKAAQSVAKGSGEHKNPKTAVKQPRKAKHKKAEVMESVLYVVENDMTDFFKNLQQTDPKFKNLRVHGDPEHDQLRQQDAEKRQQDQASRKAQGEKDAQARIEQDRGNLPQLKDQLAQLTAEYKRYGGDSWQYADRMTDNDRKAQSLGQQVHSLQSRIAKAEQGVAEAGNKPLEKSRFGTGDTRTPRDIKSQMSGASDEFVKSTADKTTGPFHSKVAKMQGKMAKSELRKREQGVAEGLVNEDIMGAPPPESNHEATMALSELYRNAKYGMALLKIIEPNDAIDGWVQANLTSAASMLDKVYHYLDYKNINGRKPEMEDIEEDDNVDDTDASETDGSMARENLEMIVEYSIKLMEMIKPGDNLASWVSMKLTKASEAVSSSKHFIEYRQFEKHTGDMMEGRLLRMLIQQLSE